MRRMHLLRSLRSSWTGYRTSLSRASSLATTSRHARWQYLSLYNYIPLEISTLPDLRHQLRSGWQELDVLGRIYISQEGVNAQLIVPEYNVDRFRSSFPTLLDGAEFVYGHLFDQAASDANAGGAQPPPQLFSKLDVRVRDQIVRDGFTRGPLDLQDSGDALPPDQWHRRLQQRNDDNDSHTMVLDVRNVYEHEIGRFDGATRIMVDTFRDTFDAVDDLLEQHAEEHGGAKPANVMMYCTGGIRCEKVGAYLRQYRGVENIQKLRGGIVNYMKFLKDERAAAAAGDDAGMSESLSGPVESLFKGKNFVFDQRCVGEAPGSEDVTADVLGRCFQCGEPTSHHTNCSNLMCGGLILHCRSCLSSLHGACSDGCKQEFLKMQDMSADDLRKYRRENASKWCPPIPNALQRNSQSVLQRGSLGVSKQHAFHSASVLTKQVDDGGDPGRIHDYAMKHSTPLHDEALLRELRETTVSTWPKAEQLIDETQGQFLQYLAQSVQAERILEIGCFTGYSAICLANGLVDGGKLVTCDVDGSSMAFAREFFSRSSRHESIEAVNSDGMEYLTSLASASPPALPFDLIFVDANKRQYRAYYEAIFENGLLRRGGLAVFDNTLFRGRVVAAACGEASSKERIASSLAEFNAFVGRDARTQQVLLPFWDGLTLIRHA